MTAARALRLVDMPPPPRIFAEMEGFGVATGATDDWVRASFEFGENKHPPPPPVSSKTPIDDLLIPLTGVGIWKSSGALAAAAAELVERGIGDAQSNEADPC